MDCVQQNFQESFDHGNNLNVHIKYDTEGFIGLK